MSRALGLALLAALMAACVADVSGVHQESKDPNTGEGSGSGSGSDTTETTTTPTGYLRQIADIYCTESFSCQADFPPDRGYTFEAQWGATQTECEAKLLAAWDPAAIESEIAKGFATYDGAAGVACLEGVTFGTCSEYWTNGIHWADACYHVIVGSVPTGGVCNIGYACQSGSCDTVAHTCF